MHTEGTERTWWKRLGWLRDGNWPVAGPHPDPDTSYETLHGSLDVTQQETRNKVLPARQVEQSEHNS
jgi:hypothetical protein